MDGTDRRGQIWLSVVTELKNRSVADILIACVDGLKCLPEAIEALYPRAEVQLCQVHLVRHSLNYVNWKQRKAVTPDLRAVYTAATVGEAAVALDQFALMWDAAYPQISKTWRNNWARIISFLATRPGSAKRSTPPTPSRASTSACANSSRNGRHFPTTCRRSNSCILAYATSANAGRCRSRTGNRQ